MCLCLSGSRWQDWFALEFIALASVFGSSAFIAGMPCYIAGGYGPVGS